MEDGFLLIDKDENWTSRDVCNKVGKILKVKKVGHIGTLDPFATGLLLVAIGKATKTLPFISDNYKTYIAELKLGSKTNTGDLTGQVVENKPIPVLNKQIIEDAFSSFIGQSYQIPPMTSAIHVNGVKLYELAHMGQEIDRKSRPIEIKELKLIDYFKDRIIFITTVSKGTYIRTLGEDIAEKLNTIGYLTALRRTKIEDLNVNNAVKIENINENNIIPIHQFLSHFITLKIIEDESVLKKIKNGGKLSKKIFDRNEQTILLIDKNNIPLAVYSYNAAGYYSCMRGLWA